MTSCFLWFCFRWIKQLLASPSTCCRTHTSNPTPVKCSETTAPLLPQRQLLGMFKGSLTPLKCNVPGTSTSSVAQKLGLSFQKAKISLWDLFRMRSVPQLCPTLWTAAPLPPSSFVRGIFQGRTLEWIGISYSRGSSRPREWTCISCISCIVRRVLYHCATWDRKGKEEKD